MSCTLNKFKVYNLGQVRHDRATGSYTVQITDAVAKCPDGAFSSRKVELVVQAGATPSLSFNGHPIVTVPNENYVIQYGEAPGMGFFGWLFLLLGVLVVGVVIKRLFFTEEPVRSYDAPDVYNPGYARTGTLPAYGQPQTLTATSVAPNASPGGTTVINNTGNGSGNNLVTDILLADMLLNRGHGSTDHTTIIERERVVHDSDSYSSDNNTSSDDSGSSSSSDDDKNSSYESDSSSSSDYSSDSSSSSDYSSDSSSSSDYSSDSGSGGSDFSSDN